MKKYVQIQSSMTITVTSGLQCKNYTKVDSDLPDRLKVRPTWPRMTVKIKAGNYFYPSEVVEWDSVKSCVRNKIMTIGIYSDDDGGDQELIAMKRRLTVALADPGVEPIDDSPTEEEPVRKAKRKKVSEPEVEEDSLEELTEED